MPGASLLRQFCEIMCANRLIISMGSASVRFALFVDGGLNIHPAGWHGSKSPVRRRSKGHFYFGDELQDFRNLQDFRKQFCPEPHYLQDFRGCFFLAIPYWTFRAVAG